MDNREIYVSTTGYAMKVLTDARVEKVLDAAYDSVADGNYAEGAAGGDRQHRKLSGDGRSGGTIYAGARGEKHSRMV